MPAENVTGAGAPFARPADGEAAATWLAQHTADGNVLPEGGTVVPAVPAPGTGTPDPTAAPPAAPDSTGTPPNGAADPHGADPAGAGSVGADPTHVDPSGAVPSGVDPNGTAAVTPPAEMPSASTPPPADPDSHPAEADPHKPTGDSTMATPAQKSDGWQVDPHRLRSFTDAVVRARSYLDAVQAKVDRMQGAEMTPQIGTSPVGQQLAKKFDDRLNSTDGLRARLAEAMKRMDDFVTSAETAASTYEELEQNTVDSLPKNG